MRTAIHACIIAAAIAVAGPASAQIINGNSGGRDTGSAPVGAKGGGSNAAMSAPGEAPVAAAAAQNDRDFKDPTGYVPHGMKHRHHHRHHHHHRAAADGSTAN